ncbi:Hypothetical_protein [Hexamita inflata]|uniref:Hypothetical_protein n=1 Tax=Hexamita inflata TaxID=28002 RepID=A0AA86U8S3_9EUKA|nr:Hypothetical protein HINF_LOCUS33329 [Hexamita inflata]
MITKKPTTFLSNQGSNSQISWGVCKIAWCDSMIMKQVQYNYKVHRMCSIFIIKIPLQMNEKSESSQGFRFFGQDLAVEPQIQYNHMVLAGTKYIESDDVQFLIYNYIISLNTDFILNISCLSLSIDFKGDLEAKDDFHYRLKWFVKDKQKHVNICSKCQY